ncbi:hypothetical protein BCR33DRAFT_472827 [Rhizoclosmatium globosum]|uniref:Uncharacterized protein n=1 Tax=Rhizoclosmatium globosum TaxID=329046 RepID=A0A1Y2BQ71_9FUNG|nr:hypothetical protein BCR33DRAFT_472827 [Rhizoclosmatium globosum]|eukprot:ORY36866.1 hypothetical protein BCR33DRAFT_472827 [Rhizoclosmatium globosum]
MNVVNLVVSLDLHSQLPLHSRLRITNNQPSLHPHTTQVMLADGSSMQQSRRASDQFMPLPLGRNALSARSASFGDITEFQLPMSTTQKSQNQASSTSIYAPQIAKLNNFMSGSLSFAVGPEKQRQVSFKGLEDAKIRNVSFKGLDEAKQRQMSLKSFEEGRTSSLRSVFISDSPRNLASKSFATPMTIKEASHIQLADSNNKLFTSTKRASGSSAFLSSGKDASRAAVVHYTEDVGSAVNKQSFPNLSRAKSGNLMSSRYGFPSTSDFRKSATNLEPTPFPDRRRSSDFSALRRKSFDQGPDRRLSNALDSEQPPQPTKPKHFNAGLAQDITDTLSHHNAVAATVAIKQKFGTGAILAAKRLARKAARRTRIRRLWSWAIDKVLRMIRATNVFSTNANKYKDTEAIKLASLKSKMVDLGFSLDTYKVQTHAGEVFGS